MARGWESKSVEAQIDAAESQSRTAAPRQTPEEIARLRKRESLILSRTRVSRELASSANPRYRAVLEKALADLNAQIEALG
jgi:hypothetical protein